MEEKFKNAYDSVLLTHSVLKRLGSGSVSTFSDRLRSQKLQYFAQLFGVSPQYRYNLYLRGPSSPDLAHDLFKIRSSNVSIGTEKFIPDELEQSFAKLKKFISGKGNRALELVATLHWLLKLAKLSEENASIKLKQLKNADESELSYAFTAVKELS